MAGRIKPRSSLGALIGKIIIGCILFVAAVIQFFPLIWLVDFSLLKSGDFFGSRILVWPSPPEWQNYKDAFTDGNIPRYLLNSVIVTGVSVGATLFLSLMMGYAFTRMKWKFRDAVLNIVLLGMIIPIHVTLIPNFYIFNSTGILNSYFALILPYIAFGLPVSMFIFTGFIKSVPKSVEESAIIDGSGIFGVLFRIVLPLVMPAMSTVAVLTFISCWNDFIVANTFITQETFKTLPFAILQFTGQYASNYGAQFAVMTIIALPSVIVYLFFTEQMQKGITAGAVKG